MKKPKKSEMAADFAAVIERAIGRGEVLAAATMIKEAGLSEPDFDAVMEGRPDLRDVYLSLS